MIIHDQDFLTEKEIQDFEDMYFSNSNSWTYVPSDNYALSNGQVQSAGIASFKFFPKKDLHPIQFGMVETLVEKFAKKHNVLYKEVVNPKFWMMTWNKDPVKSLPHRDRPEDHYAFVYYLNDSDGDTFIYNETSHSREYTILEQITPKKGSAVLLDGKRFHSLSSPTQKNLRCIVNVNLLI
jgi:hypothetical protein